LIFKRFTVDRQSRTGRSRVQSEPSRLPHNAYPAGAADRPAGNGYCAVSAARWQATGTTSSASSDGPRSEVETLPLGALRDRYLRTHENGKRGKTPVLSPDQARTLLDSIDLATIGGLRDRAIIGAMVFSFAQVSALIGMNVEDYYPNGKRWWIRLHEKGGKFHEVSAHHSAEAYLDAYLGAASISGERKVPLFRSLDRHRELTERRISRREVLAMIKRQARLPTTITCQTFRATGINA
jgi:hypothetical protein